MSNQMPPAKEPWWYAPWGFIVHVVTGALVFGVVALAAVGLAFLTHWLESLSFNGKIVANPLIIQGLVVGEYSLFTIDLVLFLVFLAKTTIKTLKAM